MRIAYGIHGYGQGHATRAAGVLPELLRQHEVRAFAGGDALAALGSSFPIVPIPSLTFAFRGAKRSAYRTIRHNLPLLIDLLGMGPTMQRVVSDLRRFRPEVVLCDCEPWTFRAAGLLGIPRIAFDHFGIMARCRVAFPALDWLRSLLDRTIYNLLLGSAERALVSSFFTATPRTPGVRLVGPILRSAVRSINPSAGGHLLAYLNKGEKQLTGVVLQALEGTALEVRLYGSGRQGQLGRLIFRPRSDGAFLEDLASCRAVISTAGNQLVGEAMQFGKALLVMPEHSVEQRMNAAAIQRLMLGEWIDAERISSAKIQSFLSRVPVYAENARRLAADGRAEALETLDRWINELSAPRPSRAKFEEVMA